MENKVELIGYYGSDYTIAQAAWTSTDLTLKDEMRDRVPNLLKMLADNLHMTPFERSLLHFNITCDTATHIHILKHRNIATNGESARYKELVDDKAYAPDDWPEHLRLELENWNNLAFKKYHRALEELEQYLGRKRAKETARFFLPYSSQLKLDISMSFRTFTQFYNLRAEKDKEGNPIAQQEVNDIAEQMLQLIKDTGDFDNTIAAFRF